MIPFRAFNLIERRCSFSAYRYSLMTTLVATFVVFNLMPSVALGDEQDELITLLDQAQQAEKQGKLTSPPNDNALTLYQQVLKAEKGQYLAWMGMMRMTGNLLRNASLAVTEQDSKRANLALMGALDILKTLGPIAKHAPESETDTLDFYQTRYLYLKDRVRKEEGYWKVSKRKSAQSRSNNQQTTQADLSEEATGSEHSQTGGTITNKRKVEISQQTAQPQEELTPFVGRTLDIPAAALRSKSPELQHRLRQVALAAREQQAFLLIVAPTDRAGRWMYDIMRKSVSGYRLRGNIQRGKPRVELQEP